MDLSSKLIAKGYLDGDNDEDLNCDFIKFSKVDIKVLN